MLRVVATAIVTATVCFAITATAGFAHRQARSTFVVLKPGGKFRVNGLDLFCDIFRSDPDHREAGPVMFCNRDSVSGNSRAVSVSKYHYEVSDESENYVVYRVSRAP